MSLEKKVECIQKKDSQLSIKELNSTLYKLVEEQDRLLELEKMKSLNVLVNGIAHEMNTPLGNCITAASIIETELQELLSEHNTNISLNENILKNKLEIMSKSIHMVLKNLSRAVSNINNFKMTAVDTDVDNLIRFNLSKHIQEIIECLELKYELESCGHLITLEMSKEFYIESYPLAIQKIITNLFENSMIHGFSNMTRGLIKISIVEYPQYLMLNYSDNGNGTDRDTRKRIFEPFFTTKMGQGCNGLGMNIVYNLVVHKLKGQIECFSNPGSGLEIMIKLNKC